jgi:PAS domain S-box-containing protein
MAATVLPQTQHAAIALLIGLLHLISLAVFRGQTLPSNVAQVIASGYAMYLCWEASRRSSGFAARSWRLLASMALLWSLAQLIWTVRETFGNLVPGGPSNDTLIIFFFSMAPIVVLVMASDESHGEGIDWERALDLAQVGIIVVSAYVWLFYLPSQWETRGQTAERMLDHVFAARNIGLTTLLLVRAGTTRSRLERALFLRAAVFMATYAVCSHIPTFARLTWRIGTGGYGDVLWSVPFVVLAVMAAWWKPPVDAGPVRAASGLREMAAIHLAPTLVPLFVLVMAAQIARTQLALAALTIVLSFTCYSLRLIVTHRRQKRTVEALTRSEQRFRVLFTQNPQPIWVAEDRSGRILEMNQAAVDTYGYSREEFLSMSAAEIEGDNPGPIVDMVDATMESRTVHERRHRHKDGRYLDVLVMNSHVEFGGQPARLVIVQDVSEQKRLEAQLQQVQKMEAVGSLAGGIAHDFNNLLTVITGYSHVILERAQGDEQLTREMQQIEVAANRAAGLIRQLLAFSRRQLLQPQALNLEQVISGIGKILKRLIGEHIELSVRVTGEVGTVKADPGQIEQVLINLAVNARDAMSEVSGGRLTFEMQNVYLGEQFCRNHIGSRPGNYVMLAVSDNGCGMDADTQSRIFEPFFTTKAASGGTGLGLSTVYGIVQQTGGVLNVQSTKGRGTTFRIYLPRTDATASRERRMEPRDELRAGTETILLVEDDDGLRELARKILSKNGYEVLASSGGSEAERICREHDGRIHLLLTDVVMPGISGRELASKLAALRPEMRVLYMSGYADEMVTRQGVANGMHFIQKPFTALALTKKLREVLEGDGLL